MTATFLVCVSVSCRWMNKRRSSVCEANVFSSTGLRITPVPSKRQAPPRRFFWTSSLPLSKDSVRPHKIYCEWFLWFFSGKALMFSSQSNFDFHANAPKFVFLLRNRLFLVPGTACQRYPEMPKRLKIK